MGISKVAASAASRISSFLSQSRTARSLSRSRLPSLVRERGVELLYLVLLFLLVSGTVNAILEGRRAGFYALPILPLRTTQSALETVLNLFTIALGTAAVYLIYVSGRSTARRRVSNLYLILGLSMLLMSFMFGLYVLGAKGY